MKDKSDKNGFVNIKRMSGIYLNKKPKKDGKIPGSHYYHPIPEISTQNLLLKFSAVS